MSRTQADVLTEFLVSPGAKNVSVRAVKAMADRILVLESARVVALAMVVRHEAILVRSVPDGVVWAHEPDGQLYTAKAVNQMIDNAKAKREKDVTALWMDRVAALEVELEGLEDTTDAAGVTMRVEIFRANAAEDQRNALDAALHMAVARLGGEVEHTATHRLNFLQRIDALRGIERTLARLKERLLEIPLYDFEPSGGGFMYNTCGLMALVPEAYRQYADGSEYAEWSKIRAAVAQASAPEGA